MSHISKIEETQVKRMNLNVPIELHNLFKSTTASRGQNMTDVLLEFIQDYVDKYEAKQSKKGKR